jgi:hypothetical protein
MQVLAELVFREEQMSGVKIEGLDAIREKLAALESLEFLQPELEAIGVDIKDKIAIYPPQSSRPQLFKTDKQRRWFFWALGEGLVAVPYPRGDVDYGSEALGRSWFSMREGLSAIVANRTSYGPLVQSEASQTQYHRATGWNTIEKVAEDETPIIIERLIGAIDKQLGG